MPKEKNENEQMVEEIATNIAQLSRQVAALLSGRLRRKAVIILLTHSSKLNQWQVEKVLEAIEGMEKEYLK